MPDPNLITAIQAAYDAIQAIRPDDSPQFVWDDATAAIDAVADSLRAQGAAAERAEAEADLADLRARLKATSDACNEARNQLDAVRSLSESWQADKCADWGGAVTRSCGRQLADLLRGEGVVACPVCGSRDEYPPAWPSSWPAEHTCGHEVDEAGRRVVPHPDGQRYPLTVGHNHTRCRLDLPHRGHCWPPANEPNQETR